jgi:MFS family permease
MSMRGFTRAGHLPTLIAALLYFDVSFMTWVLLGPLAPFLRDDLGLSATQQGLLTAIPLLGGSLFRPVMGVLADRIGGRRTALIGMALTLATLYAGWQEATTVAHFYILGFLLGIPGTGNGDRRSGQFRHVDGHTLRAASGGALWMDDDVRLRDAAGGACVRPVRLAGEG